MSDFWKRLKLSRNVRKELDHILSHAPGSDKSLKERTNWFFDLLDWIRHRGEIQHVAEFKTGTPQSVRVRHILNILDRNENWKLQVASTIRSIFNQTSALNLFEQTGLTLQDSVAAEFIDRIQKKFLPLPPDETDLAYLFQQNFRSDTDLQWVQQIDHLTLQRIQELFKFGLDDKNQPIGGFQKDAKKAILLLSVQVQALGLSSAIRLRLSDPDFTKNSFYLFAQYLQKYYAENDQDLKAVLASQLNKKIEACRRDLADIKQHLNEFGVSVQIVFQIDKLESLLRRIQNLFYITEQQEIEPIVLSNFLETLVSESVDKTRLRPLLGESFSLLSRKIVERSSETGEHYIARSTLQQKMMFNHAFGGGVMTALTCILKIAITAIGLNTFFAGLAASLNYAFSFLLIHFFNFTLATKQSSMTAPALASKMQNLDSPESFDKIIDEILNLLRTQVTAVLGNILGVVPFVFIIAFTYAAVFDTPLMSESKALDTLDDFSILGFTPIFAAFTGVLLWLSSLIAGWMDNWFAYHRLSLAIGQNRRLRFILGDVKARAFAQFLRKNLAAIAGSVSLGFLLGLTPSIFQFLGLYLDVRHVTLSSGAMTAAIVSLKGAASNYYLITAALGILSMAILNLSVSFFLAFTVAVRARKIQAPERNRIYQAVIRKIASSPSLLFVPKKMN